MLADKVRAIAQNDNAPQEFKNLNQAFTDLSRIQLASKVNLIDTCLEFDSVRKKESLRTMIDLLGSGVLIDYLAASAKHHISTSQRNELIDLSLAQDYDALISRFVSFIN